MQTYNKVRTCQVWSNPTYSTNSSAWTLANPWTLAIPSLPYLWAKKYPKKVSLSHTRQTKHGQSRQEKLLRKHLWFFVLISKRPRWVRLWNHWRMFVFGLKGHQWRFGPAKPRIISNLFDKCPRFSTIKTVTPLRQFSTIIFKVYNVDSAMMPLLENWYSSSAGRAKIWSGERKRERTNHSNSPWWKYTDCRSRRGSKDRSQHYEYRWINPKWQTNTKRSNRPQVDGMGVMKMYSLLYFRVVGFVGRGRRIGNCGREREFLSEKGKNNKYGKCWLVDGIKNYIYSHSVYVKSIYKRYQRSYYYWSHSSEWLQSKETHLP